MTDKKLVKDILQKWTDRLGLGFNPELMGEDYRPKLPKKIAAEYNGDIHECLMAIGMDRVMEIGADILSDRLFELSMDGKIVWRREVITHAEHNCEDPAECPHGETVGLARVVETKDANGGPSFLGYFDDEQISDELTEEKAKDELCWWCGGQGWWIGAKPESE